MKIAVAGAGIYGSTIAIGLARCGHQVDLYDPVGVMKAASSINQYRVHKGYHYPRSSETIIEILEARQGFISEYSSAIVTGANHYYAIPKKHSLTSPDEFEAVCEKYKLGLGFARPNWMNFDFIDRCYLVDEVLYDHVKLRMDIIEKLKNLKVNYINDLYVSDILDDKYEKVVMATYGESGSSDALFDKVELQVAEKILIELPKTIQNVSLVIVDGAFTAFDPYGTSGYSLFGSAKHTNHWRTFNLDKDIPNIFKKNINSEAFVEYTETKFSLMREEASNAVPLSKNAKYIGSKLTKRFVEYNPKEDRRVLHIKRKDNKIFVFSGKVVSAVKACAIVKDMVELS